MELHIKDRIYIPQLLPQQGKFMEFNLKREIMKKVAITDEDRQEYNIQEDKEHNRVTWDSNKDFAQPLVVDFSNDELTFSAYQAFRPSLSLTVCRHVSDSHRISSS